MNKKLVSYLYAGLISAQLQAADEGGSIELMSYKEATSPDVFTGAREPGEFSGGEKKEDCESAQLLFDVRTNAECKVVGLVNVSLSTWTEQIHANSSVRFLMERAERALHSGGARERELAIQKDIKEARDIILGFMKLNEPSPDELLEAGLILFVHLGSDKLSAGLARLKTDLAAGAFTGFSLLRRSQMEFYSNTFHAIAKLAEERRLDIGMDHQRPNLENKQKAKRFKRGCCLF